MRPSICGKKLGDKKSKLQKTKKPQKSFEI